MKEESVVVMTMAVMAVAEDKGNTCDLHYKGGNLRRKRSLNSLNALTPHPPPTLKVSRCVLSW